MLEDKIYGVISLGCDKNRVDTERLLGLLKKRGCNITDDIRKAQVVVINTCSFLNASRKEAIEAVLHTATYRDGVLEKIVVTGCLPQKFIGEIYEPLVEADVFLGAKDYDKFFEALEASYAGDRVNYVGRGEQEVTERYLSTPPHYAYLRISDGCFNHCTYCLIPKIRGKYKSVPMESLLAEAESLGDLSELILVAQDTTRYGEDLYGENKFVELLQKLTALENIQAVRLLYCYPDKIDDKLIAEIRDNPKLLHYLDIPLQHSEDRILKLMNRKGTRADYLALLQKLRREIPDIAIRSTFIAGFPGETEQETLAMQAFLREAQLFHCGFFAYSKEPDTAAAKLGGQIPYREKQKRVKALYRVQKDISESRFSGYVGKTLRVLCDGIDYDKKCFVGRAYFSAPEIDGAIYFNAARANQGSYYDVKITGASAYDLYGETEDYSK